MRNLRLIPWLVAFFLQSTTSGFAETLLGEEQANIFAEKGFIEALANDGVVYGKDKQVIFDARRYKVEGENPQTVHPHLWAHFKRVGNIGLFQVADRIFQIRGIDLANITFVLGDSGIIIIDPLTTEETARAALVQFQTYLAKHPEAWRPFISADETVRYPDVKAVIISHSHLDHFGGIWGVVNERDVNTGKVQVYAPSGFFEHAVSENLLFKDVMGMRADFMYGNHLAVGENGQMTAGLGPVLVHGTHGIVRPSMTIHKTGEKKKIDGLTFVFQMASGTEAPSEMLFFIEELRALCPAELACPLMHNLYSLRGTMPRDAKEWYLSLQKAQDLFGGVADILFAPHLWPMWGQEVINEHLSLQARLYQFLHDQTIRFANKGFSPPAIVEKIRKTLPDDLRLYVGNQGFYGSLEQNVLGIYTFYLGHFDGRPQNICPLTPRQDAALLLEVAGRERVVEVAREKICANNFNEACFLLSKVVDNSPDDGEAKALLAATYKQLGYQSPNATWRNYFCTASYALEHGGVEPKKYDSSAFLSHLPAKELFSLLVTLVDPEKAIDQVVDVKIRFGDDKAYALKLASSVLQVHKIELKDTENVVHFDSLAVFKSILMKEETIVDARKKNLIIADLADLQKLISILLTLDAEKPKIRLTDLESMPH